MPHSVIHPSPEPPHSPP